LTPIASRNLLLLLSLPTRIQHRQAKARRRKDEHHVGTAARGIEELLSDCLVSPEVFTPLIDRLDEFVVPYQHALATETDQHHMHLYLQGLLSHLPRKNAEAIATLIDVERQVMQDFIGTAPVGSSPVAHRVGRPSG
jgi:hypothetical protein